MIHGHEGIKAGIWAVPTIATCVPGFLAWLAGTNTVDRMYYRFFLAVMVVAWLCVVAVATVWAIERRIAAAKTSVRDGQRRIRHEMDHMRTELLEAIDRAELGSYMAALDLDNLPPNFRDR